jgi:hypothetical protein
VNNYEKLAECSVAGRKDWNQKTPHVKWGENIELRECPITSIPPIVIEAIGVAVPLPAGGVPVDVDSEDWRSVIIPIYATSIWKQAYKITVFYAAPKSPPDIVTNYFCFFSGPIHTTLSKTVVALTLKYVWNQNMLPKP